MLAEAKQRFDNDGFAIIRGYLSPEEVERLKAGFARFVLEARNAGIGGALDSACLSALEKILGCPLRQVLAHY